MRCERVGRDDSLGRVNRYVLQGQVRDRGCRSEVIRESGHRVKRFVHLKENIMKLSLDTYRKVSSHQSSESIGRSSIVVGDAGYRALEQLEQSLKTLDQSELMMDIESSDFQVKAPDGCDDLRDCKVRLFLDETRSGLFHIVGRLARDNSLIYMEPTVVRSVVL